MLSTTEATVSHAPPLLQDVGWFQMEGFGGWLVGCRWLGKYMHTWLVLVESNKRVSISQFPSVETLLKVPHLRWVDAAIRECLHAH